MKNLKLFTAISLIPLAMPLCVQAAWDITPAAQIQGSYTDNVRMNTLNEDSAFITTATGQIKLSNNTESSQSSITGGLSFLKFSGADDLNDKDIQFLDVSVKKRYERTSFSVKGSYRRDLMLKRSRAISSIDDSLAGDTFDDAFGSDDFIDTPDLDDSTSRLQIRRERFRVNPSLNWRISERTNGRVKLNYSEINYGSGAALAGVQGNKNQSATLSIRRSISDKNTLTISASARNFNPDNNVKSQNYDAALTWGHTYSERSGIDIKAGFRITERAANGTQPSTNDTGFVFRIGGNHQYERTNLKLSAERTVYPGAFGQLVETDRITFALTRRLSARTGLSVSSRAYSTEASRTTNGSNRDRDYFQLGTVLSHRFTEVLNVSLSYDFTWIDRKQASTTFSTEPGTASGNTISLAFSYNPR